MKKFLLLLTMLFAFSFVPSLTAVAVDSDGTDDSVTSSEQQTEDVKTDKQSREDRLAKIKEKMAAKLEKAEEAKIKSKCKSSQGKLTSVQAKVTKIRTQRKNAYREVGEKIDRLVERLKAAGIDTSSLEAARADVKNKVDEFNQLVLDYEQTLTDLSSMDCVSDPQAFKAALESARDGRKALAEKGEELKKYVKETLKPIIDELKTQLTSDNASSTQEATVTEGGTN
jgi:chromosome segregation ATPase